MDCATVCTQSCLIVHYHTSSLKYFSSHQLNLHSISHLTTQPLSKHIQQNLILLSVYSNGEKQKFILGIKDHKHSGGKKMKQELQEGEKVREKKVRK